MSQDQQQHIDTTWPAYRSNFARHALGVNRYIQTDVMNTLLGTGRHPTLKLSFEPYISLISTQDMNLTELSSILGISKQAANKTVHQLEEANYIQRIEGRGDKRARLLQLTPKGKALVREGLSAYELTEKKLASSGPDCDLSSLCPILSTLIQNLELFPAPTDIRNNAQPLGSLLARLADYLNKRLMALTAARGHPNLKLSFAHILSNVGPQGVRMQDIARVRKISKQAVSATARELEQLGYIRRKAENGSGRQQRLLFTDRGAQLIADSVNSVRQLEEELATVIGFDDFTILKQGVKAFYNALELETEEFGNLCGPELNRLAQSLVEELGRDRARNLAHILLSHEPGN